MIDYSCEEGMEKSVPYDQPLSSRGKPRDAKRRSSDGFSIPPRDAKRRSSWRIFYPILRSRQYRGTKKLVLSLILLLSRVGLWSVNLKLPG